MAQNKKIIKESMYPTNDYVFQRIFGYMGNEEITKGLINSILNDKVETLALETNPILQRDFRSDKLGILDVKARLDGESKIVDIEMQVAGKKDILKRLLYYWTRLYGKTIVIGEDYKYLKRTIIILIANFEVDFLKEDRDYHTECGIFANVDKPYQLTKDLELHIIELPKLKKLLKENKKVNNERLALWLKFISNPNELEEKEMEANKEVKMAKEELDKINQDERESWLAEKRLEYVRDMHSSEDYGREEGRKEGRKEGKQEGMKEKSIAIAKKLFEMGMSEQEILEVTELSKEELDKIKI